MQRSSVLSEIERLEVGILLLPLIFLGGRQLATPTSVCVAMFVDALAVFGSLDSPVPSKESPDPLLTPPDPRNPYVARGDCSWESWSGSEAHGRLHLT
eukprot:7510463-Pyramimonas_sp.AAC.1